MLLGSMVVAVLYVCGHVVSCGFASIAICSVKIVLDFVYLPFFECTDHKESF